MAHRGCPSPSFSQANCRCKMLAGRVSLQARTTLQAQLSQLLERISHYWCTLEGQVQPDAVRAGPDSWPQLRWVAVPLRVRRQVQVWKDRGLTPLSAWARAPGQPDFPDPRWALASTGFTGRSASAMWLESTAQDRASLFPGAMPLGSCGCFEGRGFLTSLCLCCPHCP